MPATDLSRYSLTCGYDFISLWCSDCTTDETPLETFYGNPDALTTITAAAEAHEHDGHGSDPTSETGT